MDCADIDRRLIVGNDPLLLYELVVVNVILTALDVHTLPILDRGLGIAHSARLIYLFISISTYLTRTRRVHGSNP